MVLGGGGVLELVHQQVPELAPVAARHHRIPKRRVGQRQQVVKVHHIAAAPAHLPLKRLACRRHLVERWMSGRPTPQHASCLTRAPLGLTTWKCTAQAGRWRPLLSAGLRLGALGDVRIKRMLWLERTEFDRRRGRRKHGHQRLQLCRCGAVAPSGSRCISPAMVLDLDESSNGTLTAAVAMIAGAPTSGSAVLAVVGPAGRTPPPHLSRSCFSYHSRHSMMAGIWFSSSSLKLAIPAHRSAADDGRAQSRQWAPGNQPMLHPAQQHRFAPHRCSRHLTCHHDTAAAGREEFSTMH